MTTLTSDRAGRSRKAGVLFLCNDNAVRSQMAEAMLRSRAGERFDVFSAGLRPTQIHPDVVAVMEEAGLDMSGHRAKSVSEYLGRVGFRYGVFVCRPDEEGCPRIFPSAANRVYWPVTDPLRNAGGNTEARLEALRRARDEISERVNAWLDELDASELALAGGGGLSHILH